ncbi:MAG TPA: hypothetical protein VN420_03355 [Candidatus Fimivivens sp.]|nr:hypothetical protein [Candidatus Fimivivens sp.]
MGYGICISGSRVAMYSLTFLMFLGSIAAGPRLPEAKKISVVEYHMTAPEIVVRATR